MLVLDPHDTANWFEDSYAVIPERMREAIRRYILEGIPTGNFLQAVICNDLRGAVNYADDDNLPLLKQYVRWFYNIAPANCYGSRAVMLAWIESGGMNGKPSGDK